MSDTEGERPAWEGRHGEYTDTGTGDPHSVGAAPEYLPVSGSNDPNAPNCMAFAIGSSCNEQPGKRSGVYPSDWSDVYDVGASVRAELETMGRTIRRISGPDGTVRRNEYRIALRVGTTPFEQYDINGEQICFYDYHFMVQTSTGQWAEKHGIGGASILWPEGLTPDDIPWTLGDIEYYDSPIIYYAIGG